MELERTVAALMERGYGVVLAHPERCPAFMDRPRRLRELVDRGVLCSVTAGSLAGHFGQASRWFALELVRDGLAHSVDSDAHDAERRPPGLREGLQSAARQLPAMARLESWLAQDVPAAILAGEPLPAAALEPDGPCGRGQRRPARAWRGTQRAAAIARRSCAAAWRTSRRF